MPKLQQHMPKLQLTRIIIEYIWFKALKAYIIMQIE